MVRRLCRPDRNRPMYFVYLNLLLNKMKEKNKLGFLFKKKEKRNTNKQVNYAKRLGATCQLPREQTVINNN